MAERVGARVIAQEYFDTTAEHKDAFLGENLPTILCGCSGGSRERVWERIRSWPWKDQLALVVKHALDCPEVEQLVSKWPAELQRQYRAHANTRSLIADTETVISVVRTLSLSEQRMYYDQHPPMYSLMCERMAEAEWLQFQHRLYGDKEYPALTHEEIVTEAYIRAKYMFPDFAPIECGLVPAATAIRRGFRVYWSFHGTDPKMCSEMFAKIMDGVIQSMRDVSE